MHAHFTFFSLSFTFLFASSLVNAQATITACPANAKTYTADDGTVYQHCPFTDFQTSSVQVIPNIYTAQDCLELCNQQGSSCKQAVWDGFYHYCHIKASGATWVTSPHYDTIFVLSKGAQPVSGLPACPVKPTFYEASSGAIFEICPNTDYQGTSNVVNWNIPDEPTCAQFCANSNGCVNGVWDKVNKACHIKAAANQLTWANVSTQFDTIRLIAPPVPTPTTTGFTACPSGAVQWTLDDGSLYEVCPNSDLQSNSYNIIPNVLSDWDCLHLCNIDASCVFSVFDTQYFYCHLKAANPLWVASSQFSASRLLQRGSRSSTPYNGTGRWTAPINVPANPVGAYIVPGTSRVLGFSSWGDDNFYGATGITQFMDWDFQTLAVSPRTVTNTGHDMFCPGISFLRDGRVVISGGSDAAKTSLYSPSANNFSPGGDLNIARGYQTSATLDSGEVFTIGGSYSGGVGNKTGEIYDPASNTWTVLPGCDPSVALTAEAGAWRQDNHMWLFGWKQGSVFQAGPSKTQHWWGTNGSGNTTFSGTRDPSNDAMCGLHAMYDAVNGKIWSAGGSNTYTNSPGLTNAHITTIGAPFRPATVKQVSPLPRQRAFANVVILPDGTLLVTGGQVQALVFTDTDSQFIPDLYNPITNTWTPLTPSRIPRNYHSNSLLLADGSVYTGGGGLCWTGQGNSDAGCTRQAEHPSIEIFRPPYLFNNDGTYATRPVVKSVSSSTDGSGNTAKPSNTLTVVMGDSSTTTKFSLIRIGSATHTVNSDQRRVPLTGTRNGATWKFKLPSDYGVLLPGYYYLFAVNGNGVPSYANTVQIL